ncbi:MAG: MMPL family transporter [Pseudomonadota bacterium]
MKKTIRSLTSIILFTLFTVALFAAGWMRLTIDTDVMSALPGDDPVIADAVAIFRAHPIQDQLTVDIGMTPPDADTLAACADWVEAALTDSGLFSEVGMAGFQEAGMSLVTHVLHHLPVLFSESELVEQVAPRLSSERIREKVAAMKAQLAGMDGIGQTAFFEADPLGLREPVLARLRYLAPSDRIRFHRGRLFSPDGDHVMVVARPLRPGTDTGFARRLAAAMATIEAGVPERFGRPGITLTVTPMGAYRAALDNETIIRKDVQMAIVLATIGIAVLLLISFPRPYIGLMALLPALWGTLIAFFVYSLFHDSIAIMVLGFGGAIISITVDHGIAYLLFADRPERTLGRDASREVWAVGLLAVLTTVGAFSALAFSGFPVLSELGQFSALGIFFSFITIHTVFPRMMPALPAAAPRPLPLQRLADALMRAGKPGAVAAAVAALVMLFFAWPRFNVDLAAMNTVSPATRAAEKQLMEVWGDTFNRTFLMMSADTVTALQDAGDALLESIQNRAGTGEAIAGFVPAMVFPGTRMAAANSAAWTAFWSAERVGALAADLAREADLAGFAADAFSPFLSTLAGAVPAGAVPVPADLYRLVGINKGADDGRWHQFSAFSSDTESGPPLSTRLAPFGRVFSPVAFSAHFGDLLFSTFLRMAVMVGASVVVLLIIFFLDLRLTLIALLPVVFAMVCTLGTLNLMGHALDIPALMLAIIVVGMGVDYALFLVCAYQRYRDIDHPYFKLVRVAVLLAAFSTLIGFGVLCTAEHGILRSAGLTSILGIGYALAGAFLILPPLLKSYFGRPLRPAGGSLRARVMARYARIEAYPRMFARFKMRLDPMFTELPGLLPAAEAVHSVIDIGTGFGVPACWMAETYPDATLSGIEPDPGRVTVANRALDGRGAVIVGAAPDLPPMPAAADLAVMMDMVHYLSDDALEQTAAGLIAAMAPGGRLLMRATIPPARQKTWTYHFETARLTLAGIRPAYRHPEALVERICRSGFSHDRCEPSGAAGDLMWLIFHKPGVTGGRG